VDARGIGFFGFNTPPARLGAATFYLAAYLDGQGGQLQGESTYRIRVPDKVARGAILGRDARSLSFVRYICVRGWLAAS